MTDVSGSGAVALDAGRQVARFAHRYDIVRTLKAGNGVSTYLAVDSTTADQVVLKTFELASLQPGTHARFVHETRVLRELSGVGLCALHDAGQTETHLFLAQQYAPGTTLEQALRGGPLSVVAALRIGIAVAAALDVAHGAGICHRDVKPANIIVDGMEPDGAFGSVTLIDFGFARSPWLEESIRDDLVGTVRYLSPEAAGLLRATAVVDERSDLYAIGVVLYECLVGRPPFAGPSVGDLLRQHLSTPVPELTGATAPVPTALAAVVHRLLRKDPSERYQSAAAVGADLAHILGGVLSGDADPSVVIGRHDRRATLTDPAFVGRDAELAALTALATALKGEVSGVILVDADSGGGKSRLLTEAAARAAKAGVVVVHGQGVALGGQRPFAVLHGVADELRTLLTADPERAAAVAADVADVAPAVARALPALAEPLGGAAQHDTGPEEFGELRSLAGLKRLLRTVATAEEPILVILDDCQWADALTVRLLGELFAGSDDAPTHLGVIAAFRSEDVPPGHPLRMIHRAQVVHLGPLSKRSVALLAESMAGPLPADAVETVVRLADGNPFMAAAVLRGLVESDAMRSGPNGWIVDGTRLPDVQAARRAAAFLVRRLELLDAGALELLSVGAVLGKQFRVETAVRIAGGSSENAAAILEDARRRRLIWLDASSETCTFFHEKIREALLARLDDDDRRQLHGLAADALVAEAAPAAKNDELVFDLAYHLHAAGRSADALPYAIASAELARSRYALDAAAAHYRMAREAVDPTDTELHRELAEGLGDVLMLQGSYGAARDELMAARALVHDRSPAAALDGKLGALAFKQGDIPTARHRLEGALALLRRRVPGRMALLPCLMWELFVQTVHSLFPRVATGRRNPDGRDDDFLAMRLYSRLAYLYWFHSGKVSCAWSHLRGMNLAERYPPSPELGQAWSEHAPVMTMLPWYRRGVRYAERSLEIRRELDDIWGQGQSLNFTGVAHYAASRFASAQVACEEAIGLLRRTGDQWEVNTARWNLALCLLRQGDLRGTVEVASETFETARAIGDQTAAGISLSIWARATDGRIPAVLVRTLLAQESEDAQTTAELHLADALVHRAAGDLPAAVECLERSIRTISDAGLRQEYIVPAFPWYATVLRELAETTTLHAPELRAQRLRAAARAARRAIRWSRSYHNNEPHARREAALIASMRGKPRRAGRALHKASVVADAQGARYETALNDAARADILAAGAGLSAEQADARAAVRAFDLLNGQGPITSSNHPSNLSVFDRFTTLLRAGRSIAAAPTEMALEAAVRESALALLRAERCHLIPVAALHDRSLTTQSGEDVDGISRTLLQEAVDTDGPVVALNDAFGPTDSLVLSGIRSALAVPISVQGETRSCIYVTHRQVGELFGEEEMQLAAFIATLAGAAYEHLVGSERRFRALAQSSSDVITLVDAEGTVQYQSAAVQTVFGTAPTALLGRSVAEWVHPEDVAEFQDALAAAVRAPGEDVRVECRFRHADGTYRFVDSAVTNLLGEPTVAALVLNTRDISDRKLAIDQLRLVEERERIARDLHDVVIQRLFAVGLSLDSVSGQLPEAQAREVVAGIDELHHTIRDIRGAIFSLRSDEPGQPLSERLASVVARAEQSLGFAPQADVDEALDRAAPESVHWHLLATVSEALSNVARHADASAVRVGVAVAANELVVTVTDNGRGMPDAPPDESGLLNLRRRAEMVGGSMTTRPGPDGRGVELAWRVPLSSR
ncbi:MAG: AAA family ATPase [Jatrophihabitans sp.]|uniref:protein kinase domain-containing protein n=1 Tax=Jatrophihabitans sp. TaxID=1932789 RepID=UPI003911A531